MSEFMTPSNGSQSQYGGNDLSSQALWLVKPSSCNAPVCFGHYWLLLIRARVLSNYVVCPKQTSSPLAITILMSINWGSDQNWLDAYIHTYGIFWFLEKIFYLCELFAHVHSPGPSGSASPPHQLAHHHTQVTRAAPEDHNTSLKLLLTNNGDTRPAPV